MWRTLDPPCPFLLFSPLSSFVATLATLFLLEELEALLFSIPFSFATTVSAIVLSLCPTLFTTDSGLRSELKGLAGNTRTHSNMKVEFRLLLF